MATNLHNARTLIYGMNGAIDVSKHDSDDDEVECTGGSDDMLYVGTKYCKDDAVMVSAFNTVPPPPPSSSSSVTSAVKDDSNNKTESPSTRSLWPTSCPPEVHIKQEEEEEESKKKRLQHQVVVPSQDHIMEDDLGGDGPATQADATTTATTSTTATSSSCENMLHALARDLKQKNDLLERQQDIEDDIVATAPVSASSFSVAVPRDDPIEDDDDNDDDDKEEEEGETTIIPETLPPPPPPPPVASSSHPAAARSPVQQQQEEEEEEEVYPRLIEFPDNLLNDGRFTAVKEKYGRLHIIGHVIVDEAGTKEGQTYDVEIIDLNEATYRALAKAYRGLLKQATYIGQKVQRSCFYRIGFARQTLDQMYEVAKLGYWFLKDTAEHFPKKGGWEAVIPFEYVAASPATMRMDATRKAAKGKGKKKSGVVVVV